MKKIKCFSCGGVGAFISHGNSLEKCKDCNGKGYILKPAYKRHYTDKRGKVQREGAENEE